MTDSEIVLKQSSERTRSSLQRQDDIDATFRKKQNEVYQSSAESPWHL